MASSVGACSTTASSSLSARKVCCPDQYYLALAHERLQEVKNAARSAALQFEGQIDQLARGSNVDQAVARSIGQLEARFGDVTVQEVCMPIIQTALDRISSRIDSRRVEVLHREVRQGDPARVLSREAVISEASIRESYLLKAQAALKAVEDRAALDALEITRKCKELAANRNIDDITRSRQCNQMVQQFGDTYPEDIYFKYESTFFNTYADNFIPQILPLPSYEASQSMPVLNAEQNNPSASALMPASSSAVASRASSAAVPSVTASEASDPMSSVVSFRPIAASKKTEEGALNKGLRAAQAVVGFLDRIADAFINYFFKATDDNLF